MAISNRANLDQQIIYEKYLKYFDVIDAVMCLNGDCLAVCVSAVDAANRPRSFAEFKCDKPHCINIIDIHDDAEVLLNRMYDIVAKFNESLRT
jgi:Protein of unknown function (DUF1623)